MKIYACLILGFAMLIGGGFSKSRPHRDLAQEERNKELAINFELAFANHDTSIFDKYIAVDLIQHNPQFADGREAVKGPVLASWAGQPTFEMYIERASAEGDLVWLHLFNGLTSNANVVIWRVKDNLLVEHWDLAQSINVQSANPHPFFNGLAFDYEQECQYTLINPNNITLPPLNNHKF